MRGIRFLAALMLSYLWMVAPPAQAATITVNSTVDTIADDGVCTLREAIVAANTDTTSGASPGECPAGAGVDNIILPAGSFTLTIAGTGEDAAATGDLDITDNLLLTGAGAASTIIDGGVLDRVFQPIGTSVDISGVTIQNGAVSGVLFIDGGGGGIHSLSSTLTLTNVIISGNTASAGGGIFVTGLSTLTLADSIVSGNSADAGNGGGINSNGTIMLTRTTVSGNTASNSGGAIFFNGTMTLTDSTVNNNTASTAITNQGTGVLTNCTISNNTAAGVLITGAVAANATMINCTISSNTGGGISNLNLATLKNTIVADNTPGDCGLTPTSAGHNLDSDNTCGFADPTDLPATDPLLGPLADNGGPTQTHALLPGSPAIDAADDTACPATDQRGVARPQDGDGDGVATCDIGAYEALSLFAAFDIDRVRVRLRGAPRDRFRVRGSIELGVASNGIDVLNEDVTVMFDGFGETISAGSFFRDDDDEGFQFDGADGGIKRINIRDDGEFEVRARGLNLSGIDLNNPVFFSLQIGDDLGETEIQFDNKGRFRQQGL